jgi:hypothetical protein
MGREERCGIRLSAVGCRLSAAALVLSACGVSGPSGDTASSGLVFANAGPRCLSSPAGTHKLPNDVEWLVARLLDADGAEAAAVAIDAAELAKGGNQFLIPKVAPGAYQLEVTGCREEGGLAATWRGVNARVDVVEDGKAAPVVFMVPSGRLACVGGRNLNPLAPAFDGAGFLVDGRSAFAAAAVTPSGRVVVAGGGEGQDFKTSPDLLTAGSGLWELDRNAGVFQKVPAGDGGALSMAEPRLLHGLVALDDTTLLAIGGAAAVEIAPVRSLQLLFPGALPPVLPDEPVANVVEVISLGQGTATGAAKVPDTGMVPAWAFDAARSRIGLAGGTVAGSATASDKVEFVAADATLAGDAPVVLKGTLTAARMGGAATFLSTGEMLIVGGWDGTKASPIEVVAEAKDGASLDVATIDPVWDAGAGPAAATAFPTIEAMSDDGAIATVLVLGGNTLVPGFGYKNPDAANAWVLRLAYKGGRVEAGKATAARVDLPGEFAIRSFSRVARLGASWLLAGGYRSFSSIDAADCRDSGGVALPYCFPRSMAAFAFDGAAASDVEEVAIPAGRLGATVVPLDAAGDMVLVLGGIAGIGGQEPSDWTEPYEWKTPADWILSTGMIAVRRDLFDPAVCDANRPATGGGT